LFAIYGMGYILSSHARGARIEEFRVEILYKKLWKLLIDRQVQRKLIDFRFTRDRNYNLPAKRLKALEAFLLRRITKLRKNS